MNSELTVCFCPYCGKKVWGEGFNPKTGELYFSHKKFDKCCFEFAIKVRSIDLPEKSNDD